MAKDKKALDALTRARTVLLVSQPFFGCLALHMELVEVTSPMYCNTMAVDGVHMFYWPKFVLSLTEDELVGVVAHEVHHCVYKHMTRRGGREPRRWNHAGDYVINDDLLKAQFTLPKERLHDPKFAGLSTEEVYERLPEIKTITIQIGGKGNGKGKGQQGDGDSDDQQGQQGQGLAAGADDGRCGGVIDLGSMMDKDTADKVEREWDANVRMAVAVATAKNAGRVPGYLERLVTQLRAPKVSWRDLTRQWIDGHMSTDYSWSHPNRRYAHSGMIFPGHVADALHHLVFIGDNSGSISDELMQAYGGEVAGALDEGTADKITVIYCDAAVQKVDEFVTGDLVTIKSSGGGGTDFRPAFQWVKGNAPDASCIVYLTDMEPCTWDVPDPEIPVLWAAYNSEQRLAQLTVPFGTVIHVDSSL